MTGISPDTMPKIMTALTPTSDRAWAPHPVPVPTPGPGQVLIHAAAAALNKADVVALDATAAPEETEPTDANIAGYEVAGTIVAVGPDVDTARIGTQVMASTTRAFAQYVLADQRHALLVPDGLSLEEAAALPTALLTEHGALREGGYAAGQRVLITGATSAIGLVGLQIARELGARSVLAATRSSAKADLLHQCGADTVIDTSVSDVTEEVLRATDGEGVDLVLDHVGGPQFNQLLATTRPHGILVQVGRLDPTPPTVDLDTIAYRRLTIRGVSFGEPDELAQLLDEAAKALLPAIAAGRIKPVIDRVVPFNEPAEAADRVRHGLAIGKVILRLE